MRLTVVVLVLFALYQFLRLLLNESKAKKPRIFISHSWRYDKDYRRLIEKFEDHDFGFYNHSIPSDQPLDVNNTFKIEQGIRRKMKWCSSVIVLAGSYTNSYWIKKEVEIAEQFRKKIIVVRPWGEANIPAYLEAAADEVVGYNSKTIMSLVKK